MTDNKKRTYFFRGFKWFVGGLIGLGLLPLFIDKYWDYRLRQADMELAQQARQQALQAQEKRDADQRALEKQLHEERLLAIKTQQETVTRLFNEVTKKLETEAEAEAEAEARENGQQIQKATPEVADITEAEANNVGNSVSTQNQSIASFSKLVNQNGSVTVQGIFAGESVDLCGYSAFSATPIDSGARFEVVSDDRSIPDREFTGWRRVIQSGAFLPITESCGVNITSEVAGGNTLIYFSESGGQSQ